MNTFFGIILFVLLEVCGGFTLSSFRQSILKLNSGNFNNNMEFDSENPPMQTERTTVPSRNDICRVFITGVIGTEPKEAYLANGHYVINFAVAIVGHYDAFHEWEKYKPTETMWFSCEAWDNDAKLGLNDGIIRKGGKLAALGTLIQNKWVDKTTGDDRKNFKFRILKFLDKSDIEKLDFDRNFEIESNSFDSQVTNDRSFESQITPEISEVPKSVWPKTKSSAKNKKLVENSNGDFDGFEDDQMDPRIPF